MWVAWQEADDSWGSEFRGELGRPYYQTPYQIVLDEIQAEGYDDARSGQNVVVNGSTKSKNENTIEVEEVKNSTSEMLFILDI